MKLWRFLRTAKEKDLRFLYEQLKALGEEKMARELKNKSIFVLLEKRVDQIGKSFLLVQTIESLNSLAEYMLIKNNIMSVLLRGLLYPCFMLILLLLMCIWQKDSLMDSFLSIFFIFLFPIIFIILYIYYIFYIVKKLFKNFLICKILEIFLLKKISIIVVRSVFRELNIPFYTILKNSNNISQLIYLTTNHHFIHMDMFKEEIALKLSSIKLKIEFLNNLFYGFMLINVAIITVFIIYKKNQNLNLF